MRLLLDMGLSTRTGEFLRKQGHDAVHLADQKLETPPDRLIMEKAHSEKRVVVTFDLDFSHILALLRLAQPSVILFRLQVFTTDTLNKRLIEVLGAHGVELENGAIVVVDPDRTRIHPLPIL